MAFGWSKTRFSPIAVDFGSDSLKLLQVVASDPPQLVAAASMDLPEAARTEPGARMAFFADAIKQLLSEQPFKGRRAMCSIPAYQTLVQHLQVARTEGEDFEAQIGLNLRQRLNVDPGRMVIRHFQVAQIVRDGTAKQEVLCLAASRDAVMRYIDCARRAKLDVVGMHSEPQAILRAFEHLYRRTEDEARTICFIDIGSATTKVVIAHGGDMVFAKAIHAAGEHFTRHVAKVEEVPFLEARKLRIAQAARTPAAKPIEEPVSITTERSRPHAGTGNPILDAQVAAEDRATSAASPQGESRSEADEAAIAGDTLDCLIDELQLCVRYHQSIFPGRAIEKLVFLGGESRHVTTCQKIARALRIGAQLGDPLARLVQFTQGKHPTGVDMREPQPGWAVPMGLCLSEANI